MARTPRVEIRGTLSNFNAVGPRGPGGFAMLAEAAGTIANVIRPAAVAEAREQGANAVFRDENGVLRVDERSLLGGEMAAEHNRVAFAAYLAQQRIDLRDTMTELSLKHQDDPAAFKDAAEAYRKLSSRDAPPTLRADVDLSIADETSRVFNGLRLRLFNRNLGTAERNIKIERKMAALDAANLFVENRGQTTPEFEAKVAEIIDMTRLLVTMGAESEADIELQTRTLIDKAETEWLTRLEFEVTSALKIIRAGGRAVNEEGLLNDARGTELFELLETAIAARNLFPTFARSSPTEQAEVLAGLQETTLTPEQAIMVKSLVSINEDTVKAAKKRFDELDAEAKKAVKEAEARLKENVDATLKIIRADFTAVGEEQLLKIAEGTKHEEPLRTAMAARELRPGFKRSAPPQQVSVLGELKGIPVTPELARAVKELEAINETTKKAVLKDGIGAAQDAGEQIGEVSLEDPRTLAARRQAAAALGLRGFNPDGRFFTDPEKEALSESIEIASPEDKGVFAQNIIEGFGDDAPRAIRELGVKGVFGHAAQLLASGADPKNTAFMFAGEAIERPSRPKGDVTTDAESKVLGGLSEAVPPEVFAGLVAEVREAAQSYYAARVTGVEEDDQTDLYEEALQAALGRSGDFGGVQEVNGFQTLLSPTVRGDAAEIALERAWESMLPDFTGLPLVAAGRGARTPKAIARQEVGEAAGRDRFNTLMSSPTFSISGGVPMNGRDPVDFSDLGNLKLVAVGDDVYELHVERADDFVALTDSQTGGAYLLSLQGLIEAIQ